MISAKLNKFLSENKVKFEEIPHRQVFTGLDKAATLKVKPGLIAKTLVLKDGKNLFLAVLAANRNLNKEKFKKVAKAKNPDFISEKLIKANFKGYQIGAVPPFGGLFRLPSFVDRGLAREKLIYISAGTYENSLKISPKVLEKMGAVKADFSQVKKVAKPIKIQKKKK